MAWHVAIYITVGRDQHVITNGDLSNDYRIYSDPHIVTYNRCPLSFAPIFLSYKNAFVNINISSQNRLGVNGNIIGMSYVKSLAYFCIRIYLNTILLRNSRVLTPLA